MPKSGWLNFCLYKKDLMKDPLVICNDDGIQMLHQCVPGQVEASVQEWVDFFLVDCGVNVFAFCTARPDKTHHETQVGERDYDFMTLAPAQSQLHYRSSEKESEKLP
jgi:hypothetical protein